MSPSKARELRVRIAELWLKDRDLTVTEIATRVGCYRELVQKVLREVKKFEKDVEKTMLHGGTVVLR